MITDKGTFDFSEPLAAALMTNLTIRIKA